ncbi:hypothetical protein EPN44_13950 [bacterium]|nr:MAG: hypothetical protein EPN44_13950 [bacterium]
MAIDQQHFGDGDFGMRDSAGVPRAVIWLAFVGFAVIVTVGGFVAFNSNTGLMWPPGATLTIPLGL